MTTRLVTLLSLVSIGCVADVSDSDFPTPTFGADGVTTATSEGTLGWSAPTTVTFADSTNAPTEDVYLSFSLASAASVTIATQDPSTSSLDTMLYLYQPTATAWGSYLDKATTLTETNLAAGDYRVVVQRKTKDGTPSIGVTGTCSGTGCSSYTVPTEGPQITSYFLTPTAAGLQPVIDAINSAQTSINMEMFHLTEMPVAEALANAATANHVTVQVIIDQDNWNNHTDTSLKTTLSNAGVTVTPSSTKFRITHEKSFVVDNSVAFIMSLNLTSPYVTTRDYAVSTTDAGIIAEFQSVFAADLVNAQNSTANTPTLSSPYLVWSPVNSETRLTALVDSAQTSIIASSENLGDPMIQAAFIAAAARGVQVQVMSPLCDQNADATFDLPYLSQLAAGGVQAQAMPEPETATQPYIHAKMIIADGARAYIGSVNLSSASTTDARELGIFFTDANAIGMIQSAYTSDWALSEPPPAASTVTCPTTTD